MQRKNIDLCGLWRFQPDASQEGEKAGYFHTDHNCQYWREAMLPCDFETCFSQLDTYEGTGWFRRIIEAPKDWEGRRLVIRFEGANYHTKVWINGHEAGENYDGFLPFQFPIHDFIHYGQRNLIAVRVDNF